MNPIQAIVRLLLRTKLYIAYPKLIEGILQLMTEYSNRVPDEAILEKIEEETSEKLGPISFIPDEPGGLILVKNSLADSEQRWSVVQLPPDPNEIDLDRDTIYGLCGFESLSSHHALYPLRTGEIIGLIMAQVSGERVYTNDPSYQNEDRARSIVYENISDETFEIPNKNINITFFNCRNLIIKSLSCPTGGLKLVKCQNIVIHIKSTQTFPIILIYAFYCSNCKIVLPREYEGDICQEISECWNFLISQE